jgi:hypothetical protein
LASVVNPVAGRPRRAGSKQHLIKYRLRRRIVLKTVGVEFFCYHRDRLGSVALRDELVEEHWSYMVHAFAQAAGEGAAEAGNEPPRATPAPNVTVPATESLTGALWRGGPRRPRQAQTRRARS